MNKNMEVSAVKNKIFNQECLGGLKKITDNSIDCCVTSPPYWGLRNYGVDGQLGLEDTPEEFVSKMVLIFTEVKRVLRNDGTLWLNLGDSYGGSGKGAATHPGTNNNWKQGTSKGTHKKTIHGFRSEEIKPKDLVGVPWMVAFALRSSGWYLRQDIIWSKPNPMPESVTDRCTKSHEYIFLLSKSKKYYYDNEAIKTPLKDASIARLIQDIENQKGSNRVPNKTNGNMKAVSGKKKFDSSMAAGGSKIGDHNGYFDNEGNPICSTMANKKSVWTVNTKGYKEAHFATFPEKLIIDCIKAGCPENGVVLDPFMGAGTTALVARKLNRNYIGFELNKEYIEISNKRLNEELGMFL